MDVPGQNQVKYPTQTRTTAEPRAMPPSTIPPADPLFQQPIPVEAPAQPAEIAPIIDPPAAPAPAPRKSRKLWIAIAAIVVVAAIIAVTFIRRGVRSATVGVADTAVARHEDFLSVLRLAGTVEAVQSHPVIAPRLAGAQLGSMILTSLIPAGTRVKKGDLLAEFDRQAQRKDYLDKKASYEDFANQVIEKQAAEDVASAKDQTELQQATDSLAKARLEVSKNDILSRIDAEKNTETLQEAEVTLKQLQETFKLKREAAAAGIRTLAIQRDRARATMDYAQQNSQRMVVRAPMDGVAVLNSTWLGGRGFAEPQQGDQIWPGMAFMKVVDPSTMAVSAMVNEEDLPHLHVGQHARIHLDAYPDLSFPGTLEELAPMGESNEFSDKVRTFAAIFTIEGASPKLMPDLTAFVDVELARANNALVIPVQSAVNEDGHEYVWVKTGLGFEKRAVQEGLANDLDAVIVSGLREGDIVLKDGSQQAAGAAGAQSAQAALR